MQNMVCFQYLKYGDELEILQIDAFISYFINDNVLSDFTEQSIRLSNGVNLTHQIQIAVIYGINAKDKF